ncbi:MAG TPA: serine hydrolase domain-containing protein [Acidimicrobiales bacterium]|nr:serine hydrolase domain-containing protein [Acidimicrobiales bacterium]
MDIGGTVAPGFEPVRDEFARNFAERGEVGAACCVYRGGEPVVDLWGGTTTAGGEAAYTDRTLQMVASATKGALAIVAHRLAERGELDLDAPVARYWPEFAAAGKERLPVRWLLSHQAGLPAVHRTLSTDEIAGWAVPVAAVAAEAPAWEPGTDHGYHAITYGWLVGEVINRVTGSTCGRVFAEEVAGPLGLDLHIGLPPAEHHRVAPLIPAPPAATPDDLTARLLAPDSLAHWAFLIPSGLFAIMNDPVIWAAELPAANGMGTAHALARLYAAVVGTVDGVRLLAPATVARASEEQCRGIDRVAGYETAYALGFQLPFPFRPMAGAGSFGHYGLGGSVGFAHPGHGFTFGYTVNQMGPGTPADRRSVPLIEAVVRCCAA